MDNGFNDYGDNPIKDMMADDCLVNVGELPELLDEDSINNFIANLNDWD